jgi:hypothetical protein
MGKIAAKKHPRIALTLTVELDGLALAVAHGL